MAGDILHIVGKNVRKIRKTKNMSQEQLGEVAGFHFSYIGRLERAEQNLSLLNLEKIANALGVSVIELFMEPKALKKVNEKEGDLAEIMELLRYQNPIEIKRVKNTVKAMMDFDK
jgi:transcriptional regulator with XRE-family HTH domain